MAAAGDAGTIRALPAHTRQGYTPSLTGVLTRDGQRHANHVSACDTPLKADDTPGNGKWPEQVLAEATQQAYK